MQLFLVHFRGYHMPGLWCLRGFVFARTQNPSLFHTQLCMDYVCELDATRQTLSLGQLCLEKCFIG